MRNDLFLILSTLGAILALASLAGFFLRGVAKEVTTIGVVENLNARIRSWWWMAGIFGSAVFAGPTAVIGLFAAISFLSLREFLTVTVIGALDRRVVVACFLIVLPAQYALIGLGRYDMFVGWIPAFALLFVPVLTLLTRDPSNFLARTAELVSGLMICVYGVSYVPALLMLPITGHRERQILLVVFLVVVAQASDVLQYVWGKLLGRRKIAPSISPSKTVGGLIGGIASATAIGASLWWITPFSIAQAGAMAFLIAVTGFLGGLIMSAIKRDRGIKDWSHLVPGHGGALDRLDSICFSAPIFFYATRIVFSS
jgi:phosphatidate cytidylyltransferase